MFKLFVLESSAVAYLLTNTDGYREVGRTFNSKKEITVYRKWKGIKKGQYIIKEVK